ncbi:MAG: hypothetical protein M1355_00780 [Patescibacteria group bacterium]|nr:hypothetical protein [Patescibacteria group bacterium]MCL5093661.1 hypothetical protein [Patescibacteria group bacterium]
MKLKVKDIITVIISIILIIGSGYYIYKMVWGGKPSEAKSQASEVQKENPLPEQIDSKTYDQVNKLTDYGKPTLENLGKVDPFTP